MVATTTLTFLPAIPAAQAAVQSHTEQTLTNVINPANLAMGSGVQLPASVSVAASVPASAPASLSAQAVMTSPAQLPAPVPLPVPFADRVTGLLTFVGPLDPRAVAEVNLYKLPGGGAPDVLVTSKVIQAQGQPGPLPFVLDIPDATIDHTASYGVSATLFNGYQQVGATTQPVPVLMKGSTSSDGVQVPVALLPQPVALSVMTGTVSYMPFIALDPRAVVQVQLLDVSKAGAPAQVMASQVFQSNGRQVPIPFALRYHPDQILPTHTYQVRANIAENGQPSWVTTQAFPVLTNGNPDNDVNVVVTQAAVATPLPAPVPLSQAVPVTLPATLPAASTDRVAGLVNVAGPLDPHAVAEVSLYKLPGGAAPDVLITSKVIQTQDQNGPLPFALDIPDSDIDHTANYGVSANLYSGYQQVGATSQPVPVLKGSTTSDNVQVPVALLSQPVALSVLNGTVSYMQRIALDLQSVIQVQLLDVTGAGAPVLVTEQVFQSNGRQVPIPFALRYRPDQINPTHTYHVNANIYVRGRLQWITPQAYPVLTHGNPDNNIDILLAMVP
jgi:uncharacterized lipoprotein YbaY